MPLASVYPLVSTRSLARPFTYEVPEGVGKGAVVAVRLGRSSTRGVVADVGVDAPEGVSPAPVGKVLDEIPATLVDLALWIADYYGSTPARALELVAPLRRKARAERPSPAGRESVAGEPEPAALTAEQRDAVVRIVAALDEGIGAHLLLAGPTGSGKTEVYLQACAAALERGLGTIVLVPEIALAPQTVGRFRERFGDTVAILHSQLSDAERRDERERIARWAGPHRRRRPLRRVRAHAAPGADRRRRGARRLLQAGLRPPLRRTQRRRQARRARGGGRGVRKRHAAARELGQARAHRALRPHRRADAARPARRPAPRGRLPALRAAAP